MQDYPPAGPKVEAARIKGISLTPPTSFGLLSQHFRGGLSDRAGRSMIPPSFLPLQVAIYFNGWYLWLLYLAELALVIYKGQRFVQGVVVYSMCGNHSNLLQRSAFCTRSCCLLCGNHSNRHYFLYACFIESSLSHNRWEGKSQCFNLCAALVLPYPDRNLAAEIILLFVLALLDAIRLFLGESLDHHSED